MAGLIRDQLDRFAGDEEFILQIPLTESTKFDKSEGSEVTPDGGKIRI